CCRSCRGGSVKVCSSGVRRAMPCSRARAPAISSRETSVLESESTSVLPGRGERLALVVGRHRRRRRSSPPQQGERLQVLDCATEVPGVAVFVARLVIP